MRRVRLGALLSSATELSRFREILAAGGVAAIPTETFYGLAADPTSARGVARVFEIKRRDAGKPLLVLFSEREHLERLGIEASSVTVERFLRIWPAALTVVLPLAAPIAASRGAATLGVRMPAAGSVRKLLDAIGPITATSANRSGSLPFADPEEVARTIGDELDLVIDDGPSPGGQPSTVVDATAEPPRVIRAGAFPWPPG